jgi:transposase InsO family protein
LDEEKRLRWAQFRFEVIAPLVCRRLDEDDRRALRRQILSKVHRTPDGDEKPIAERTLRAWTARYGLHGFDGLKRMTPPTKGKYRAIPEPVLDQAEELRRELPTRSIRTILSLLRAQGIDTKGISRSTLNFHLNLRGAPREKYASEKGTFQRFQKEHANDLWQADSSGGLWLPDPLNRAKPKLTKLISFVDDATRIVTHAQFYFDEQLPSLIDCFRKALLSRGKPGAIYCDNGPVYISKALARTCSQLGIELIHAQEFFPEGKGKIERHIGTVKAGFYQEAKHCGLTSLDELNTFFFAWLEQEYHSVEHSELKMTPFQRWQQDEQNGMVIGSPESCTPY